jgi:excisionase family DNA binding protein
LLKLLTVKETATLLRVTPHSVYRLARTGAIPSLRIGHQVRFDEAALEAWLAAQASAPAPEGEAGRLRR